MPCAAMSYTTHIVLIAVPALASSSTKLPTQTIIARTIATIMMVSRNRADWGLRHRVRVVKTKSIMVSATTRKGCYISILNIIQGAVDPTQVRAPTACLPT